MQHLSFLELNMDSIRTTCEFNPNSSVIKQDFTVLKKGNIMHFSMHTMTDGTPEEIHNVTVKPAGKIHLR